MKEKLRVCLILALCWTMIVVMVELTMWMVFSQWFDLKSVVIDSIGGGIILVLIIKFMNKSKFN